MSDLDVDDLVLEPFSKASHAILELGSCFEPWVGYGDDIDMRKRMADKRLEVLREGAKGVVTSLRWLSLRVEVIGRGRVY